MTILSSKTIERLGIITPFCEKTKSHGVSYGASSAGYDIRLASSIYVSDTITALGISLEYFTMPNNVVGIVHDKSTWARSGFQVQNTVIEPGWCGHLTLELTFTPLLHSLYKGRLFEIGTPIAQVIFHYTDEETVGYTGKYQDATCVPQAAIFEE